MADSILVVVETIEISDKERFATYQGQARQQLLERGGSLLARGGTLFEGAPLSGPVLIQRWPSEDAFREWQDSEEYRPLRDIRNEVANLRITIVPEV